MKIEKGKIFNTQEVQAIIAGNKTMFRDDSRERQSLEIEKARQLLWKWMESNEAL